MKLLILVVFFSFVSIAFSGFNVHHTVDIGNVYVIYDDDEAGSCIIVDSGFGTSTTSIIDEINNLNRIVKGLFLTHGHQDHISGAPALSEAFPEMSIYVASDDIKEEVINSATNDGINFDFENEIEVIDDDSSFYDILNWDMSIYHDFEQSESDYFSVLVVDEANFAFVGDIIFKQSHLYLGTDLDLEKLENWKDDTLEQISISGDLGFDDVTIIYPGYGDVASINDIKPQVNYINKFIDLVTYCNVDGEFNTLEEVKNQLLITYPNYINGFFLDFMTTNTAWTDLQDSYDDCIERDVSDTENDDDDDFFGLFDDDSSSSLSSNIFLLLSSLIFFLIYF